jgi:ceramide glucosyltransferase
MTSLVASGVVAVLLALSLAACFYTLFAAVQVRRLDLRPRTIAGPAPAVSILKPLYSAEPGLYENLASFCAQDYPGIVQIVLGIRSPDDPAVPVVERLIADLPGCDVRLVFTAGVSNAVNDKVANLAGIAAHASYDTLIVSDSDIAVDRNYVATTVAELDQPGTGAVTWLYRGVPLGGVCSRLARMAIDHHFLPSVLVGRALGLAHPCFGSTIALTRATLTRIGGFEAFGQHLADDYAIGDAVRALGLRVAIPPGIVAHACTERSLRELVYHELRWARTVRAVDPAGFAGSLLTHPLPLAVLAVCAAGFTPLAWGIVVFAALCRLVLQRQVDHTLGLRRDSWWLAPARDALSFVIYIGSFFVSVVRWRGRAYQVRADGTLAPVRDTRA